ncbi:MAG: T9SS type A sorting domain-containing protein [Ginsengibacter sp.]
MKFFTLKVSTRKSLNTLFPAVFLILLSLSSQAQTRGYSLVYSDNIKGGSTILGNTLMHIITNKKVDTAKMNNNRANGYSAYGNDDQDMEYIDIDGNSGNGSVTMNSSSADLVLPTGTNTIKLARIYWGGRVRDWDFDLSNTNNRTIKIRKGTTSKYSDVTALGLDDTPITGTFGYTEYQAYADITAFVKTNGAGTYEVGNVPLSIGSIDNGGNHGGWSIVVVYENSGELYKSVRVYDGFQQVYSGGNPTTTTVTLTGLDVPSGTMAADDAKMGVVAWEGDANLTGDFLKINGNTFSNETNASDNPWNGTITDNGKHVTTKNPNYTNQMGIDIDIFNVGSGYGIFPNANSVTLLFGTEQDQYYPGVFTFSIKMKDPTITLDKTVSDANKNHLAESGETLTYTLKGANNGIGNANYVVVSDTLPSTITYKPGTLKVISSPGISPGIQSDQAGDDIAEFVYKNGVQAVSFRIGTGATSSKGGTLASGETYEVQFQVTVNDPGKGLIVPSIMNIARVTSASDAGVNFVDDGTAIINPEAGPLPVTLTRFSAKLLQSSKVEVDWTTSMEINSKLFVLQRSYDGTVFLDVQTIAGNGTTNLVHDYSVTDDLNSFTGSVAYYRLKQIDLDGKENLSKIIPVKLKATPNQTTVSPNPFSDYININTQWDNAEMITVRIFNVQGKMVASKKVSVNKGENNIRMENLSILPSGNYYLEILSATKKIVQKITK